MIAVQFVCGSTRLLPRDGHLLFFYYKIVETLLTQHRWPEWEHVNNQYQWGSKYKHHIQTLENDAKSAQFVATADSTTITTMSIVCMGSDSPWIFIHDTDEVEGGFFFRCPFPLEIFLPTPLIVWLLLFDCKANAAIMQSFWLLQGGSRCDWYSSRIKKLHFFLFTG